MSKVIQSIRIRRDRAEILRDKAIELTIKRKEYIRETDLINFFIDGYIDQLEIDINGIYLKEEDEKEI